MLHPSLDPDARLTGAKRRFLRRLDALHAARARGDQAAADLLHRALRSDAGEIGGLIYATHRGRAPRPVRRCGERA